MARSPSVAASSLKHAGIYQIQGKIKADCSSVTSK